MSIKGSITTDTGNTSAIGYGNISPIPYIFDVAGVTITVAKIERLNDVTLVGGH